MSPVRPTIIGYEKVAEGIFGNLLHVVVGLFFMGGGAWMVYYAINHPPLNKVLLYGGGGTTLFGALILPTILPVVKQIVVFIVPYIPLIGGKRAGDPPAPPAP